MYSATLLVLNWLVTIALMIAVLGLYRVHGEILLNTREKFPDRGPKVGSRVKAKVVAALDGRDISLGKAQERTHMVFFAGPRCPGCLAARDPLSQFADTHKGRIDVVVVCRGTAEEVASYSHGLSQSITFVADDDWTLGSAWRLSYTPFAILFGTDGRVLGKGMPTSHDGFEWFVRRIPAESIPLAQERHHVAV